MDPGFVADVEEASNFGNTPSVPKDPWAGGKQRLTSQRLHEMLVTEGFEISPRSVRSEVAEWKRLRREVFVPLVYKPGFLAEVDFFETIVDVDGHR